MKPRSEIRVVAAVIERADRHVLICQRKSTDRHALKWEFPGGKVEPDEEPREALRRELQEELDITAEIGEEIGRYEFQYSGRTPILLIFFRVTTFAGELHNQIFEQMIWESPAKLPSYDFLDGDVDFVRRLARGHARSAASGS